MHVLGSRIIPGGVPLTWILILLDATLDSDGNPTEGNYFGEDPWLVRFRDTNPENLRNWAATKPMEGTKYDSDKQEFFNNLIGLLRG